MGVLDFLGEKKKEQPAPVETRLTNKDYSARLEMIRVSLMSIPDLYLNFQRTKTGMHNINALFNSAESIAARMIEILDALTLQIRTLANNLRGNINIQVQKNLIEMIATKLADLNSFRMSLEPIIEDLIGFIREVLEHTSASLQDATAIKRKDLVASIIPIQRQLEAERDHLMTLKKVIDDSVGYYAAITGKNVGDYKSVIATECLKTAILNSLRLARNNIYSLLLDKSNKTLTKLLQVRTRVSQLVTTI